MSRLGSPSHIYWERPRCITVHQDKLRISRKSLSWTRLLTLLSDQFQRMRHSRSKPVTEVSSHRSQPTTWLQVGTNCWMDSRHCSQRHTTTTKNNSRHILEMVLTSQDDFWYVPFRLRGECLLHYPHLMSRLEEKCGIITWLMLRRPLTSPLLF